MGIIRELMVKPWLVIDRARVGDSDDQDVSAATLTGLQVYFAVATVMFSLITAMYLMRMGWGHPEFGLDWSPTPESWLLWVNTVILILSSVAFHRAQMAARAKNNDRLLVDLLIAGLFSFAFLGGQLLVWRELTAGGYFLTTNPANSFYYLLTGMHGVHLLGGLVAWGRTTAKVWGGTKLDTIELSVKLCTVYWHFLLIVWLAMFYLLLAT